MATVNNNTGMALTPDQLNHVDEWILDYLSKHEWATPNLLRIMHGQENEPKSRQWISDRVTRLEEHGHLARVHPNLSERRLVSDPRRPDQTGIYDCNQCEDESFDNWKDFQHHLNTVHDASP